MTTFTHPHTGEVFELIGSHTSTVRLGGTPARWLRCAGCCDSGRGPKGENSRSEVEGEAPQSGAEGNRPTSTAQFGENNV